MSNSMTTKNLQEISEILDSEFLAYKKCCNYALECTDATLKNKLNMYANAHRARFENLFNYLNTHN